MFIGLKHKLVILFPNPLLKQLNKIALFLYQGNGKLLGIPESSEVGD